MKEATFWNKTIERSLLWFFASGLLVLYSNIHWVDPFCDFGQIALLLSTFLNLAVALSKKTAMEKQVHSWIYKITKCELEWLCIVLMWKS